MTKSQTIRADVHILCSLIRNKGPEWKRQRKRDQTDREKERNTVKKKRDSTTTANRQSWRKEGKNK